MPFQSEKQRRYMHANLPKIANRWEKKYGSGGIAELNAELNSLPEYFMPFPAAQGGRIGFNSGTNYKTRKELIEEADLDEDKTLLDFLSEKTRVGSDKYNIKLSPEAELNLLESSEGGYDIKDKNITYGADTTANIGPFEIGMDYKKFLDKYEVTKDGTTVEKDTSRDRQIAYHLGIDLDTLYAKVQSDKDFKNFYFTIRKTFGGPKDMNQGGRIGYTGGSGSYGEYVQIMNALEMDPMPISIFNSLQGVMSVSEMVAMGSPGKAHGGLISSHEAGIYGLAEGGRTGFFTGMREAEQQAQSSGGGGGYQSVHDTGAVTQTPGRPTTTTTTSDDGDGRSQALINISKQKKRPTYTGTEDLEEQLVVDEQNALNRLKFDRNLTKNERENLEVGLGFRPPKPKKGFWGTVGTVLAVATGLAPILGIKVPGIINTAAQASSYMKKANYALDQYNKFTGSNHTFKSLANKVTTEDKLRAETKKLQQALPRGHPERIALEAQKKTRTLPKDGPRWRRE